MPLSDFQIKNLKPRKKRYKRSDGDRLFVVIEPNGSKLWHFRYEFANKPKTLSIGVYPKVSLSEARERKLEAQTMLRNGIDPSTHKQQQRATAAYAANNTFEKVSNQWYSLQSKSRGWSIGYSDDTWARIENHVLPYLGKRAVSDIASIEILQVLKRVEKKGNTETCHRLLGTLTEIFNYARIFLNSPEQNPTSGLSQYISPHEVEHYPTISESEIPNFLRALEELECRYEFHKYAFWLLLLTAVRQCELRFSKKSDILLNRREWVLREEVTKMKRVHIVPLSDQAIVVANILMAQTDSEWLVPATRTKNHPVMSEATINCLIKRMGYKGKIVGHGTRSLFSTALNDHGFDSKMVDRELAHVGKDKVERAYNRAEYEKGRREMMQWWGDFLDSRRPDGNRFCPRYFAIQGSFTQATPTMNRLKFGEDHSQPSDYRPVFHLGGNPQLTLGHGS